MTTPPPTRREAVEEVLHGTTVADPYRWLEDGSDPEVRAWVDAQNFATESFLSSRPAALRRSLHDRLVELMGRSVVLDVAVRTDGDRPSIFTLERLDGADQHVLTLRRRVGDDAVVLADPTVDDELLPRVHSDGRADDHAVAIDWFAPSPTGALVALGVSEGGTENSTLRIVDVAATLARGSIVALPTEIQGTRACSLAWEPDGSGFLYTRYPDGDEYHRTVHSHRLGDDPGLDPVVWAEHVNPQTWPSVDLSPDGRWLLVHAMVGWGRVDVVVRDRHDAAATWVPVITGVDARSSFAFTADRASLVGMTTDGSPNGRIVVAALEAPVEWRTIVPERDDVISAPTVDGDDVIVVATRDAVDRIERWPIDAVGDHGSEPRERIDLGMSSVITVAADPAGSIAIAVVSSYSSPNRLVDLAAGHPSSPSGVVGVHEGARVEAPDPASLITSQVTFPSRDGTDIPMFLVHRADVSPGPETPTILNGYGGFAISLTPTWSPSIATWCERGGLYAVANLRGGIERGDRWHAAGRRGNKQNVFDDFHAAADWLVATGRTGRDRLAISGRSNGGLLVGVAMTQHPDLCAAVDCGVALLDMIRFPRFLIARLWTDEYGDPDVAEEFAWLHAYSPYHHVRPGVSYPPTLFTTAEGDTRVDPMHARKMAAAVQHAVAGLDRPPPVLLSQERRAGHGVGKPVSMRAAEQADVLAFLGLHVGLT